MAKPKKNGATLPAVQAAGGALQDWEKDFITSVEDVRATYKATGSNFVSVQQGHFVHRQSIVDEAMEAVIILGAAFDNAYYDIDFDRNNPSPPACYAVAETGPGVEESMGPPEGVPEPQSAKCSDCWANAFATARSGKAKACKNSYRLAFAVLPRMENGAVDEAAVKDPGTVLETAFIRVPPTSLAAWKRYVNELAALHGGSQPWRFITKMNAEPVANAPYSHILFKSVAMNRDRTIGLRIADLRKTVQSDLVAGYDTSTYAARKAGTKSGNGAAKPTRATAPASPVTGRVLGGGAQKGASRGHSASKF